jgi:hypothetical protein
VKVTFDPGAAPQFTFKPNSVRVKGGPKTVVLIQDSPAAWEFEFTFKPNSVRVKGGPKTVILIQDSPAAWEFVTGFVKDDTLHQFSSSVHGNGKVLHIDDALKDPDLEAYSYNITVKLGGQEYTSPDPHIVNDPP